MATMSVPGSRPPRPSGAHFLFFSCFAGPDRGKRLALAPGQYTLGRAATANVMSEDPDVAPEHAMVQMTEGRVTIGAMGPEAVFLDGHQVAGSTQVFPGQQIRVGRSVWQIGEPSAATAAGEGFAGFVDRMGARVSSAAGLEKIQGFDVGAMFSEVAKRRTDEEKEEYFAVGTRTTTPALNQVETNWPKPWAFARAFGSAVLAYGLLVYGLRSFGNPLFLPGVIVLGSLAIPLAVLVLFFEINVPRNISLYQVIKMVLFGGIISILVSLFGFQVTRLSDWLGAMAAGVVEESGKALTLLLFVRNRRFRWTLNGLLIGAAVGTGFSIFETMGYVFRTLLGNGLEAMTDLITTRGWLAILADHALWTGLVGAALWRVRGERPFEVGMLQDQRFLRVLGMVMLLHAVNNAPISPPLHLKFVLIGFVAWAALISFMQDGLRQVRSAQVALASAEAEGVAGVQRP